ncbi:melanopsin-like [Saccostrea cucullata]|uniref:melanopsin-like n=1 Tax=Saccostrea cuccullata TaxID=36930 RepID=UPI002ECFE118
MFIYANVTDELPFQPKPGLIDSVLLAFGIPIFLANILGTVVVWRSIKLPFQIRLLTLNMSYADGGIGLFMLFPRSWLYKECNVRKYLLEILGTSSFLTITAFNIDRCLMIFYAIHYTVIITKSKIFTLCITIWIFSLFIVYLLYSNEKLETLGFSCEEAFEEDLRTTNVIGQTIRVVIIIINVIILIVLCVYLKKKMQKMSHTGMSKFKVKHWDYQAITLKKILVITIFFTVLYTPYMICQLFLSTHVTTRGVFIIKALSALASMLNSFVNPFLYIFRFKECRFQLKLLFCRWNKSVIEVVERERKQSFASYTIDDSLKLRLQALHKKALENTESVTSKSALQSIESVTAKPGQDSTAL